MLSPLSCQSSPLQYEMSMTSESDEKMMPKNGMNSPSVDDANSGGNVGGNGLMKKGPWTSAEDAILVEYVTKHGEGNWNAVQKNSGLARCGKSCRLRWANHLRPNLKKGAFSPEEEQLIVELHAKLGNKWARMAAELPGRTDNEIKNYWNTRIKRRQRAGLPIYPPDIYLQQSVNENQQTDTMSTFSSGDEHYPDFMMVNNFEIPSVEFKNLELNRQFYPSTLLDIPTSSLLVQDLHPSYPDKSFISTVHPTKRLRGPDYFVPGLSTYQNDSSSQIAQSFMYSSSSSSSSYYQNSTSNHASSSSVLFSGSHAFLNGNPSSSEPTNWAMKLELPSLQTPQVGPTWGSPSSPLPSLESFDTLIQTPPTEQTLSCNVSPLHRNSGLLDAVLHESQIMTNSEKNSQNASINQDFHEKEWKAYGEPKSPLGHSSSSVSSVGITSFDEPQSLEKIPGCKVKEAAKTLVPLQYDDNVADFLPDSDYFGLKKEFAKDHFLLKDAIGTLLDGDLSRDCKKMDTSATSSAQGHGHGHDSCAWNPMYTV